MPLLFADRFAVEWTAPSAAFATTRTVYIAPYDVVVQSIAEIHSALGTDGGAVNLQVTHETGTQAPGAGAALLSNNSNAGFNLKAAINTPQFATWKVGSSRRLAKGDRLSVKPVGVQTAVDGLNVSISLRRYQQ